MKQLFKMGSKLTGRLDIIVSLIGFILLGIVWYLITKFQLINPLILPSPGRVLRSYGELYQSADLTGNILFSVKLNVIGYIEAIAIALPVGFIIGLIPVCRSLFSKYVDAIRFIPLTAVTGIFIAWFGIEFGMKVHFLAFGILIYLLPVVVQRIDDVETRYTQTIWTLGANNYQTIQHVYLPSVLSKISDDIRVLVAISWTYIIVAELVNKEGGVGAMIFTSLKQGRIEQVYAILSIIIIIGFIQDKFFKMLDKTFFSYKYANGYKIITYIKTIIFKK